MAISRGFERYAENPFLKEAFDEALLGKKNIALRSNSNETTMFVHGDVQVPAGFHQIVEVDKTQFVKIYLDGIRALTGLTAAGLKVFEIVYLALMDKPNKTEVLLNFSLINQQEIKIGRSTFFKGIKELIANRFLAESLATNFYHVNIAYIYNGDRIALIKEYRMKIIKPSKNITSTDYEQIDLLEIQETTAL